ncbi:DUF4386 family protein [Nostocoides sp. F2B08]|uniref:DUF4386 domain-containing protein n=1 Tax=Nostocoides sp. F2B08 TaxID=2653936 RepID=UPI0012634E41|nr:DUF4386 domain-containing protein [Tetrasphaera sp. F2B08]KAB7745642.1 DUF4386 family protein [Tetrasphaera sp. F2B08]
MSTTQQAPSTSARPITLEPATTGSTSQMTGARVAGAGYIAIFVLAIFANFLAIGSVLSPGDAGATAESLAASHGTVRIGAIAFLVIFVLDIAVAWALHMLFRRVHTDLSLLSAWFRLGYSIMLGTALVFLFAALALVSDPTLADSGSDAQVLLALRAFDFTWVAGLAAFGIHLVLLGRLLQLTDGAPKALAYILMVAGTAYAVDTVAHLALADYEAWSTVFLAIVAIPSVIGEAWLAVWLLLVATGRRAVPVPVTVR